ncbi:SAF domain-containing protein [Cellulomonas taurus]|uniref:SAF domain-containing protein n=1 Tax=Cellulomonas taurus TaxID=2729175 RepID=UPI00145D4EF0|nr:SAF domain-containing protein [Cellulomonas taurus]
MDRLPPSLRRLLWRGRRPAAALCLALAALLLVQAIRSPGPPTSTVLVAARDIPLGSTVGVDDLARRPLPTGTLPDGVTDDDTTLLGARTAVEIPAGLPLVAALLADTLDTGPPGTVTVPVRFADASTVGYLMPGRRVDVVSTMPDSGAVTVATGALVLSRPGSDDTDPPTRGSDDGVVLLAVDPDQAVQLSAASASTGLSAILVE